MIVRRAGVYLEMVKFSHTVFALPFVLMGAFLAARGLPPPATLAWTVVAAVGARTCAMAFNRLVDRHFDALNPRTATRALVVGTAAPWEAAALVGAGGAAFVLACRALNPLAAWLSPLMLMLLLGYSLAKRVTSASHLVLGSALALAPFGGWIAVRGEAASYPVALSLAVLFWVAGFDTVYAALDEEVDRALGLHSLPARLGRAGALRCARLFHAIAFAGFVWMGIGLGLGWPYLVGMLVAGAALLTQHLVLTPDLARIQRSFLAMNGVVSVVLFAATWLALAVAP